jgi:hypothetical protein
VDMVDFIEEAIMIGEEICGKDFHFKALEFECYVSISKDCCSIEKSLSFLPF